MTLLPSHLISTHETPPLATETSTSVGSVEVWSVGSVASPVESEGFEVLCVLWLDDVCAVVCVVLTTELPRASRCAPLAQELTENMMMAVSMATMTKVRITRRRVSPPRMPEGTLRLRGSDWPARPRFAPARRRTLGLSTRTMLREERRPVAVDAAS